MRMAKYAVLGIIALVFGYQGIARAAIHERWLLDYEGKKPNMFTYVDPAGRTENFWYVVYTVSNNGTIEAPLHVDITLKDDHGRHAHMGFLPNVENQVIAKEEHLTGLSKTIQDERIAAMKAAGRYLNCSEQRARGSLKPGESLQGIAVFPGVALDLKAIDVLVLGLINPVKYRFKKPTTPEEEKDKYELESRILKLSYHRTGNSLYLQFDAFEFDKKEWIVKVLGILSDKETIGLLVGALDNADPMMRKSASDLLGILIGDRKGYDPDAAVEANKNAILAWREWWSRNKVKLVYDELTMTFVVKEAGK